MRPLVLTFVDRNYIPVGRNWLQAVSALGIDAEVRIVALDAETRDALPAEATIYRPSPEEGLGTLLQHRIGILCEALDGGRTVVHSDADAVWVRDPLGEFKACGTEMVFTQGTVWPPDVHAGHGLVLCCGLYWMRSTPAVRLFMSEVGERAREDRSDQASVNRLIAARGLRWRVTDPYAIGFRGTSFTASRTPILSAGGTGPAVAVLPHHKFPRLVERLDPEMFVVHPLSSKTCAEKEAVLSRLGLWQLGKSGGSDRRVDRPTPKSPNVVGPAMPRKTGCSTTSSIATHPGTGPAPPGGSW